MLFSFFNKTRTIILILALVVFFDRLFKQLSLHGRFEKPVSILGDFFQLLFVPNHNIAFSLPLSGTALEVLIFTIIISLIILLIFYYKQKKIVYTICLFGITIGASSNLFDRIKYGYVIDYLDVKYFSVFNLADSLIVVGTGILAYMVAKEQKEAKKLSSDPVGDER